MPGDSILELFDSSLESLRTRLSCPELQIFAQARWGSQNPDHRKALHAALDELVAKTGFHTSISHCPSMGIFAAAPRPLGVDIEIFHRVQAPVIARISSSEELSASPSPASLWCAKEAVFKALRTYKQPSVISKISIGDWEKIDSHLETYRLLNSQDFNSPLENRGIVLHLAPYTCSFFIFSS